MKHAKVVEKNNKNTNKVVDLIANV